MAKPKKAENGGEIYIAEVNEGSVEAFIVGRTPLIINRLAEKARQELLMPKGRKTAADKAGSLKHNPVQEFRSSAYTIKDDDAPTYLAIPSSAPKRALASAALDIPGAKKAQVGRLTYVTGELLGVYGIPKLFMAITRSADMNKTPDVRTRCIVPEWAIRLKINFVTPILKAEAVLALLNAAGLYIGVGDWRPEKGSGNYGQFTILPISKQATIKHILAHGRKEQIAAMENPVAYNDETQELLAWFVEESQKRGHKTAEVEEEDEVVEDVAVAS
jgi:hypothetical protein